MVGDLTTNFVQYGSWRSTTADCWCSERADRVQFSPLERDLLRTFASLLGNIPKGLYERFGRGLDYVRIDAQVVVLLLVRVCGKNKTNLTERGW